MPDNLQVAGVKGSLVHLSVMSAVHIQSPRPNVFILLHHFASLTFPFHSRRLYRLFQGPCRFPT